MLGGGLGSSTEREGWGGGMIDECKEHSSNWFGGGCEEGQGYTHTHRQKGLHSHRIRRNIIKQRIINEQEDNH